MKVKSYLKTLEECINEVLFDIEEHHYIFEFYNKTEERRKLKEKSTIDLYIILNNKLISKYYDLITIREIIYGV